MKRSGLVAAAVVVLVTNIAFPGLAHPAQPTNYESVVVEINPLAPMNDLKPLVRELRAPGRIRTCAPGSGGRRSIP